MTLRYYDGSIDERECIAIECNSLSCKAIMVNPDYTTERVEYDNLDYQDGRKGEPKIDATSETMNRVREKALLGHMPSFLRFGPWRDVHPGDVVEVVKGRKYPKGTLITIKETYVYTISGTYGHGDIDYILGTNGEKVACNNCIVKSCVDVFGVKE